MNDNNSNIAFIKKYNESACNELYSACSEIKQDFIKIEDEKILEVKNVASAKILEINKGSSTLYSYLKKIISEKVESKAIGYENKMKEYKIF